MEHATESTPLANGVNGGNSIPPHSYAPAPQRREFTAVESIFAWLCLLAGYAFCRVVSVVHHPMGGFLFVLALFGTTAIVLKVKGVRFWAVPCIAAVSAIAVSTALILCANSAIHFFAYAYALIMYLYFVFALTGNTAEKGFSDLWAADFVKAAFIMPFYSFAQIFRAAFSGKAQKSGAFVLKLLLGIALTVVPTAVVLVLLSYDSDFIALLRHVFDFTLWDVFSHIGSILFGIPIAMYIFGLFISSIDKKCTGILTAEQCRSASRSLKIAPGITVLAAVLPILGIYLLFFISQWKYFVSGFSGKLPENFSYAQYAREGFFQLCTVSVINFVIIALIGLFMRRKEKDKPAVLLRVLSIVFSVFTLVLISTAAAKMILYINCFGLTSKRIYASWLMAVLALLFILIIVKQFACRLKLLAASAAVCVVCFAGLALSGTDSLIAQYNVDRYLDGTLETVDIGVMESLGDAAVPQMVRLVKALDEKYGTDIAAFDFKKQKEDVLYYDLATSLYKAAKKQDNSFFGFTVPRMRAKAELEKAGIIKAEQKPAGRA